ncbi:MAG: HDOD domain-containing protein [Nitrospirae bacterium]|nr:HDOD domain-containing protein [Nitrospirota bacterium]
MAVTTELILQEVEAELDAMHLGFRLSVEDQAILDEPHLASKYRILELEDKLPVDLKNELFRIASSPLYSKAGMQKVSDFWEVSAVLGLENIKAYIFSSALFGIATSNQDVTDLKNKALATAGLSMAIMHNVLGFGGNTASKVQLCALVSEFGKIPLFIYRQNHISDKTISEIMTDDFINIHHGKFGLSMVEKFNLPDFLKDLFDKKSLIFFEGPHEFSITTIVRMVKLLVRDSFKHHGKLVLTSVVDDQYGIISGSVGTEIQGFFDSLGIGNLIEVIPFETTAQQNARRKKAKP